MMKEDGVPCKLCVVLQASETRTKDKEVPIHVYEHTLSRYGTAMPAASIHATIVPNAHRGAAGLGNVFGQANGVSSDPNDSGRYTPFRKRATSVRSLLQLFQSLGLGGIRLGPSGTEWSLAHMLRILRTSILADTINPKLATKADLYQLLDDLKNYL